MAFGPMPPAEADATFTIVIPKEAYPYLKAFYALKKLDGEVEEAYIVRCLIQYGKDYYTMMAQQEIAMAIHQNKQQAEAQAKALIDSI